MDSLNTDQNQDPQSTDISDAIAQIKQWETAGKTQDAIDGCKEILEIDTGNTEAKEILARLETVKPAVEPITENQEVETEIKPEETPTEESVKEPETKPEENIETPAETPLYKINTEETEQSEPQTISEAPTTPEKKRSHGIVLNIVLFIVVASIIGGGVYAYLYFFQGETPKELTSPSEIEREEVNIADELDSVKTDEEETTIDTEASRNDQRFIDLTFIETKLEEYYAENHVYPPANELEEALGDLPKDPIDEGEFMYTYAIYDNYLGENQEYILSGIFEDAVMGNTTWTTGVSPNDHPDYRDPESENVVFITSQGETATEEESDTPKVKVKREE